MAGIPAERLVRVCDKGWCCRSSAARHKLVLGFCPMRLLSSYCMWSRAEWTFWYGGWITLKRKWKKKFVLRHFFISVTVETWWYYLVSSPVLSPEGWNWLSKVVIFQSECYMRHLKHQHFQHFSKALVFLLLNKKSSSTIYLIFLSR